MYLLFKSHAFGSRLGIILRTHTFAYPTNQPVLKFSTFEAMTTLMLAFTFVVFFATCQAASTSVRLQRNTVTVAKTGKAKNFYSATISVGEPAQEFRVAFDLGGGTTVLPSASCTDKACLQRRRFDKWASDTAADIQADGSLVDHSSLKTQERVTGRNKGTLGFLSADLGSGQVVGGFVRDRLCLSADGKEAEDEHRCFPLALLVAYKMTDIPFGAETYDGTIGLSLQGMSITPEFNFLNAFMREQPKLSNNFGLYLGGDDGGEITFGGYDAKQLSHPLEWVTVAEPEDGRWQVAISAIRIGNNTLKPCRGGECRAIIDYGASLLSVPPQLAGGMEQALEMVAVPSGYGDGCQVTVMPDLQIVLSNDVILTLPAEDYVSQVSRAGQQGILSGPSHSCRPLLAHHDFHDSTVGKDVFVLGESVLRRYHTIFDGDAFKVGFSLASGSEKGRAKALPLLEGGKGKEWLKQIDDEEDGNYNPVILLVQVKLKRSKTISSLGL